MQGGSGGDNVGWDCIEGKGWTGCTDEDRGSRCVTSILQDGGDEWVVRGGTDEGCDDVRGWAGMAERRSVESWVAEVTVSVDAGVSIVAIIGV